MSQVSLFDTSGLFSAKKYSRFLFYETRYRL